MSSPHPFPFRAESTFEAEKAALQGTKMSCLCFGCAGWFPRDGGGKEGSLMLQLSRGGPAVASGAGQPPESQRVTPKPTIGSLSPGSAAGRAAAVIGFLQRQEAAGLACAEQAPARGARKGKLGDSVKLSGMKRGTTDVPGVSWCRGGMYLYI